jgi:NADH:ubiquinone oxidoreductase subunit H
MNKAIPYESATSGDAALADIGKLTFKEDFVPDGANRWLFRLAPIIPVVAAVASLSLIPFGGVHEVWGHTITMYGADLDVAVLLMLAFSSLGAYGLILGGWASGNKYSLLGAARNAAQLVSYEVALGLSIIGVIIMSQSLSLVDIVNAQAEGVWYILLQPVAFVIFMISAFAETNRTPFDLGEAESELRSLNEGFNDFQNDFGDSRQESFEAIKNAMNKLTEMQQALSNILNTMHHGAMNTIGNIR